MQIVGYTFVIPNVIKKLHYIQIILYVFSFGYKFILNPDAGALISLNLIIDIVRSDQNIRSSGNYGYMVNNNNKHVYVYLEGSISRKDPEHHGDPVKDNDKEHPVREYRGIQHQHKHPVYQYY